MNVIHKKIHIELLIQISVTGRMKHSNIKELKNMVEFFLADLLNVGNFSVCDLRYKILGAKFKYFQKLSCMPNMRKKICRDLDSFDSSAEYQKLQCDATVRGRFLSPLSDGF